MLENISQFIQNNTVMFDYNNQTSMNFFIEQCQNFHLRIIDTYGQRFGIAIIILAIIIIYQTMIRAWYQKRARDKDNKIIVIDAIPQIHRRIILTLDTVLYIGVLFIVAYVYFM